MSKKSRDYWNERFRTMEAAQHELSAQKAEEIRKMFDHSIANIEKKIAHWYYRVAENNEVSMAKAMQMVSKRDLEEFRWTVDEYIKHGQENAKNQKWMKELENASARAHIGWLEMIKYEIRAEAEKLFDDYTSKMDSHIMDTYMKDYYHTAYEIQKGFEVGSSLQRLDKRMVEKVIHKPWAVDGRNFSERIWDDRTKLVNTLHKSLSVMCITGAAPDQAISEIAKTMGTSRNRAGTLVMTESAAFANKARQECMEDLDVEEFEVVETLDTITCSYCQEMDEKHFPMDQFEIGVTAPPFHPNCRGCTCPYFDDEFMEGGERAARGEDGKTYYVPADMDYSTWYNEFVQNENEANTKTELTQPQEDSKMTTKGENMSLEYQRYGRNKDTVINNTYINSGEYKNKFDKITDNKKVSRVLYSKAKEMLQHRSGTKIEDMYWIDGNTGEIVASALNEQKESSVVYADTINRKIQGKNNLIVMHTHPSSMPPSIEDFNSALAHGYAKSLVICHDGTIYEYTSKQEIQPSLQKLYIEEYIENGYTGKEAQLKGLEEIKRNYDIDFWEVK